MRIKTGSPIDPAAFGFPRDGLFLPVTAIATDSREILPDDLFIALSGEKNDGADHIAEAFSRGAAAAISHGCSADPHNPEAASE